MKPEHYFLELQNCIRSIASKGDLLLFDGAILKKDWEEILENVVILHIFHIAVFRMASPILKGFIEKESLKEKMTKKERKDLGAFFTPPYIAEYICKETLGPMIDEIEKSTSKDKIKKISKLTVCDPAMGGGIFLVCAQDYLMERMIQIEQDKYTIEDMATFSMKAIYGVDINPKAVEFTKMVINLNTAKWKLLENFDNYPNNT